MQFSLLPLNDTYTTIANEPQSEYKDKNSKFLGYAFEVNNDQEIKNKLEKVRQSQPKASHYCYAYKLGLDDNNYRANDDGEPSGTAGRPIYNQILSAQFTNILIVIVRYYGGINLGVSGLKEAYKTTAKTTLQNAVSQSKIIKTSFQIEFQYPQMPDLMSLLKTNHFDILKQDYQEQAFVTVAVRLSLVGYFLEAVAKLENVIIKAL